MARIYLTLARDLCNNAVLSLRLVMHTTSSKMASSNYQGLNYDSLVAEIKNTRGIV